MGRLILLALLTYLVTWCVLWLLTHAKLLVIGLLSFGVWSWTQSKNRQIRERP